jgi:hypothetical protein
MQVWSECISRVPQPSNYLAGEDPIPCFDGDRARLHLHHDAVLGVAMIDDRAIAGIRHNRVAERQVPTIDLRLLSRMRVGGYVIARVDHRSSRGREDLAARARIRCILVGIVSLRCVVGIQAAQVYGRGIPNAAVATVRDPVLPKTPLPRKGRVSAVFCW